MADSQTSDGQLQRTQDNPVQETDKLAATDGEREALNTARSELHKTMAEVAENPPSEQPPPPSLAAAADDINYEDPVPDPYNKAISYLEKHNILQIFQTMTASIIFQKPDNPLDFMITEIGDMKQQRDSEKSATKQK
ncbi:uncharacterized protein [Littorina saxatilis]|uniref:Uncharacterized protein n=1 Tax=Littorina saxatilis TaxID=31220 RepID=A0AAN9BEA3_9CAEN